VLLEDRRDGYLRWIEKNWGGVGLLNPHGSEAIYLGILLHAKVTPVKVSGDPDGREKE
jgi:hypothetical protein